MSSSASKSNNRRRRIRVSVRNKENAPRVTRKHTKSVGSSASSLSVRTNGSLSKPVVLPAQRAHAPSLYSVALPRSVVNIDAKGCTVAEPYWEAIMENLFLKEAEHAIPLGFSIQLCDSARSLRGALMNWLVQVQSHLRCRTESLHLAAFITDRCSILQTDIPSNLYQLVGTVCLFIACKCQERFPPLVDKLLYLTDNTYTKHQFLDMELRLLALLDFKLVYPTGLDFLNRCIKAATIDLTLEQSDLVKLSASYLMDLSLLSTDLAPVLPSKKAAGAVFLARKLFAKDCITWTPTLVFYSHYTETALGNYAKSLASLLINTRTAITANFYGPFEKYARAKYQQISQHHTLSHTNPLLLEIAFPV